MPLDWAAGQGALSRPNYCPARSVYGRPPTSVGKRSEAILGREILNRMTDLGRALTPLYVKTLV